MRHNTDNAIKIEISINKKQRVKIKLVRISRFYEGGHEKTMTISVESEKDRGTVTKARVDT